MRQGRNPKRLIGSLFLLFALFLAANQANALANQANAPAKLQNPLGTTSIQILVGRIATIFIGISGSLALLFFVYGGLLWLTSGGNPERINKGKQIFTWATIGLIIIFGSYAIISQIFKALGA